MKGTARYSVEIMLLILFFWRILEPSYNMIPLSPDSLKANKKHVLEESFYSALKSNHFWAWEGGCFSHLVECQTHCPVKLRTWLDGAGTRLLAGKRPAQAVLTNSVQPVQPHIRLSLHISGERNPPQPPLLRHWLRTGRGRRAEGGPHAGVRADKAPLGWGLLPAACREELDSGSRTTGSRCPLGRCSTPCHAVWFPRPWAWTDGSGDPPG